MVELKQEPVDGSDIELNGGRVDKKRKRDEEIEDKEAKKLKSEPKVEQDATMGVAGGERLPSPAARPDHEIKEVNVEASEAPPGGISNKRIDGDQVEEREVAIGLTPNVKDSSQSQEHAYVPLSCGSV